MQCNMLLRCRFLACFVVGLVPPAVWYVVAVQDPGLQDERRERRDARKERKDATGREEGEERREERKDARKESDARKEGRPARAPRS